MPICFATFAKSRLKNGVTSTAIFELCTLRRRVVGHVRRRVTAQKNSPPSMRCMSTRISAPSGAHAVAGARSDLTGLKGIGGSVTDGQS